MKSKVITSDSRAAISRKDDLMILFEFNKYPKFKVINLNPTFLFDWENVPGNESDLLVRFLKDEYEFTLKQIEINKSDHGKIITVFNHESIAKIPIDGNDKIIEIGNYYNKHKLKVQRDKSHLIIKGEKYNLHEQKYCFDDILYCVDNFEEIQEKPVDGDNRKLLNYLEINTGYERIYKSSDSKALCINRERLAKLTIHKSKECAHLEVSNGRSQDMPIKIREDKQCLCKKILKESHNTSLHLEKLAEHSKAKYNPLILFSKNGESAYISDYFGNLILWYWSKEPNIAEKECGIWDKYNIPKSKTMLEARFINQNLFRCDYMNLYKTSGITEEKIQALIRIGAVIDTQTHLKITSFSKYNP
jgi:hypothetical protein